MEEKFYNVDATGVKQIKDPRKSLKETFKKMMRDMLRKHEMKQRKKQLQANTPEGRKAKRNAEYVKTAVAGTAVFAGLFATLIGVSAGIEAMDQVGAANHFKNDVKAACERYDVSKEEGKAIWDEALTELNAEVSRMQAARPDSLEHKSQMMWAAHDEIADDVAMKLAEKEWRAQGKDKDLPGYGL
jgi:hypothetical protein